MISLERQSLSQRLVVSFVLLTFLLAVLAPIPARAQAAGSEAEYTKRIDKVYALRSEGKYEEAIGELRNMIQEFASADEILRALYNELTKTVHSKYRAVDEPTAKAKLERQREAQARETLRRYPDIEAGVGYSLLDGLYDRLRREMFGELQITTSPDSCHVIIDDLPRGPSPFYAMYFPVGKHAVEIIKSGHEEKAVTVEISPGGKLSTEVVLKKIRGKGWWLTRIVAPVAAAVGTVLALVLTGGDDTPPPEEDEPLPPPPPPPTD
jgi:hypothetical protein